MSDNTILLVVLLILESLGTWELLLVGMVALVVFGPRKIPELARKAGKLMAEFRKVSNDFRATWEEEASLDDEERNAFNFSEEPVKSETPIPELVHPSLVDADLGVDSVEKATIPQEEINVTDEAAPEITELTDEKQIDALKKSAQKSAVDDLQEKENWF